MALREATVEVTAKYITKVMASNAIEAQEKAKNLVAIGAISPHETNEVILDVQPIKDDAKQIKTWAEELFSDMGKPRGLAIMILDIFEDMLDAKGVMVPDDDRTGDDGEACLYGCTYGDLEEEIVALLNKYI